MAVCDPGGRGQAYSRVTSRLRRDTCGRGASRILRKLFLFSCSWHCRLIVIFGATREGTALAVSKCVNVLSGPPEKKAVSPLLIPCTALHTERRVACRFRLSGRRTDQKSVPAPHAQALTPGGFASRIPPPQNISSYT